VEGVLAEPLCLLSRKPAVVRFEVVRIDEAINVLKQRKYEAHKAFLSESGVDPNERRLFHGTRASNIPKILVQGFNRNFAGLNGVLYGRGVYFAREAGYSVTYCPPDAEGISHICVCDVLVGCAGQGSPNLAVPPARPFGNNPNVVCDSTVDNIQNPNIFVCYHDDQVSGQFFFDKGWDILGSYCACATSGHSAIRDTLSTIPIHPIISSRRHAS
jgi:hypothetical protein